jgi:hypothetical protein
MAVCEGDDMSMNSMTLRWRTAAVSALVVVAMLALLGGCGKKAEQAETKTEEAPAAMSSPMAGTYSVDLTGADAAMTQKLTLTLNADNTALMSMAMAGQPAMGVENGTWAMGAGANMVDVSFPKQVGDSTVTFVFSFAASGDSLTVTNLAAPPGLSETSMFPRGAVLMKERSAAE